MLRKMHILWMSSLFSPLYYEAFVFAIIGHLVLESEVADRNNVGQSGGVVPADWMHVLAFFKISLHVKTLGASVAHRRVSCW